MDAAVVPDVRGERRAADAFKSNRWDECAQMPGKRPDQPPTTVPAARCAGGRPHLALACRKAGRAAVFTPVRESIWGIPV